MSNITETETALTAITEALSKNEAEHARYRAELAEHERSLAAEEAVLREFALPAKRGDEAAQKKVDSAIGRMRDAEAAHRLLIAALLDLERERKEFEAQKATASENKLRATRDEVRERKRTRAAKLDAAAIALGDEMEAFARDHLEESQLSQRLGEPQPRALAYAWPTLFGAAFWRIAPAMFDKIPPSQMVHSTFTALCLPVEEPEPEKS
jgi:hypothetical protein